MLDTLRPVMGHEKFFAACREFFQSYSGKSTGTAQFREFWKAKLEGRATLVDVWLDSAAGLPALR